MQSLQAKLGELAGRADATQQRLQQAEQARHKEQQAALEAQVSILCCVLKFEAGACTCKLAELASRTEIIQQQLQQAVHKEQ